MNESGDGVVLYRATRLSMIEAVRSAHPAPAGRLRRNKRLSHAELADAILATLPEAEPDPLNSEPDSSIIDAANATIAELRGRCDELFAANRLLCEEDVRKAVAITDLRKAVDGHADARHDIELVLDGVPGLPQDGSQVAAVAALAARCLEAEAQNITLREALAGGHLLELADLRAKVADYENAIAWNTSCTACARTLDSSIAEHERADKAEQKLAAVVPALERFAAPGVITATDRRKAASDALSAAQGDADVADPYAGLGSGGMIP